jgi:hypothetical protein
MLERLLVQRACLQSIGFLLESIQLPLLYTSESPMLVHFSIAPILERLVPLVLVLVEVLVFVVLALVLVVELVLFQLARYLVVLLGLVPVVVLLFVVLALVLVVVLKLLVLVLILFD